MTNFSKKNVLGKTSLLTEWGDNEVHTSTWINQFEVYPMTLQRLVSGGYLKKLGGGAYTKAKDPLDWQAAVYAAQSELQLPIHVGGQSVFDITGSAHFIRINQKPEIQLIARKKIRFPIWLRNNEWSGVFQFHQMELFTEEVGLETLNRSKFIITVSSRERAILEMLNTVDLSESFEFVEQYFDGLNNIRSELMQNLLECCKSIKVKRVFGYIATKAGLPVISKLNLDRIDFGSGKRVVVKHGVLDKQFNITVPKSNEIKMEL